MTIKQLLKQYHAIEIDLLLSHILRQSKEFLYVNTNYELTNDELTNLKKIITRRKNGEPIAYIVGYKYFYGLKFKVNKFVLIPRPETEWLVTKALATVESRKLKVKSKAISILDVGTGSGCIPISIANQIKDLRLKITVSASDISKTALTVAKQNAKIHQAKITFIQSDLFKNIPAKFDIITANLPYVPQGMYELLFKNLQYEPKTAITDGGETWELYYKFFTELPRHLHTGGSVLMEIDDESKIAIQKMTQKLLPTFSVRFYKDDFNRIRYCVLKKTS